MDRLRALRIFFNVAEHASFAEAGRRLNLSPATVTRSVAALEASIGVPLLMRTTRSVRLTEEGMLFLERCRAGMADIDEAFDIARGTGAAPRGTLTITAPVMFGRLHVLPIVTEMLELYPDLHVRLLLLDRVVQLVEEGVDIAVRIAELPDSAMHMLKIGQVRRVFSASPAYLAKRGVPATIADLGQHDLIVLEGDVDHHWSHGAGRGGRAARPPRLAVNSMDAAIAAAVAGLGVVQTFSYQVADQLAAGNLKTVLDGAPTSALPLSLLFQSSRKDRPNIRAFVDLARRRLAGAGF